jgi:hypothetical protein
VALRVVADACAGLHAAHELPDDQGANIGIVHRDVSPHNILLSTAGAVKVIDFGVMKAKNRKSGETKDGIIKGKVRYMAPEQVHGKPVDRRADVWGMGVVLYELVTGEVPFEGDTDVDVIRRLMSDEAPPRPPGAIPDVVERIIERSLVRERSARFSTCALMGRAVEAAIDELALDATGEDVAEFLRAKVPELSTKRRQIVQKALDAARARDKAPASQVALVDDAFAPTLLSGKPEAALGLTPSAPSAKRPLQLVTGHEDSKVTPKATLLVGETQRGGGIIWILFVLIVGALSAGAWFVWPGQARLRQAISSAPPPSAEPSMVPSARPPPSADPLVIELDAGADLNRDAASPGHNGRPRHTWPAPTPSYERFYFDAASILAPKPAPPDAGVSAPPDENNPDL